MFLLPVAGIDFHRRSGIDSFQRKSGHLLLRSVAGADEAFQIRFNGKAFRLGLSSVA